jgi:hypothetical protein
MGAGCSNETSTTESSIVKRKLSQEKVQTEKTAVTSLPLNENHAEKDTVLEDLDTPTRHRRSDQELVSWVFNRFKNRIKISKISKAYERFIPR